MWDSTLYYWSSPTGLLAIFQDYQNTVCKAEKEPVSWTPGPQTVSTPNSLGPVHKILWRFTV